jgi:hypothetical protein
VQSFVHASTTIPKTYTNNTFAGNNIFNGTLTLGTLNGPLDVRNGLVGATTSIGLLYGGTGATSASAARTNLGAAASGANSDITSLLGLTTALTTAQGGQTYKQTLYYLVMVLEHLQQHHKEQTEMYLHLWEVYQHGQQQQHLEQALHIQEEM